ncbi:hypothetical protein D6C81_06174 [Aureobasidium pullulans]|uniref:LSM domain-containing protein n=1 Tax=Aureobasidium pullulans TaxID=5580 RepID=A0AB74IKZ5_AURPU|nr:hypothetical protein D6D21_09591 [Aureobasidium pullulans]THX66893.1 hypothetical protein D6D08_06951 [Aureobasidium pullulans]TIA15882.1 hypothetical protein D6C81_06174 [Aureobasidium pullulans]
MDSNNAEATEYLTRLLNKTLRIHTTDSRIFVGTMKCTDQIIFLLTIAQKERNIILSLTHEYRQPPPSVVENAAMQMEMDGVKGNVKVDMLKRFVGLVVVPGRYITKIEVEE